MALTASSLTDSLAALPTLPSAAALSASSRAVLKDLPLPTFDLDRLDALAADRPRQLPRPALRAVPFSVHWPRLSRHQRRQLTRQRRRWERTIEHTLDRTFERNRDAIEHGTRRLGRTRRHLATSRTWSKPTATEQLIDFTAQLVAPRPEDPAPRSIVLDTVAELSEAVRDTVADQVVSIGDGGRSTWRRLLQAHSEESHASLWSSHSSYSALSTHSFASLGSALSVLCAGSILSIGSTGSILSIGSVGSVLSIGSAGSVLSIGGAGRNGLSDAADVSGGAAAAPNAALLSSATRVVQLSAGVLGACAVVAAALRD